MINWNICKRSILILSTLDFQYMCRCQHMFLIPCQFCSHSKKAQCLTNTLSAKLVLFCFSIEEHFIRVRLDFALYATGLGRKWEVAEGLAHTNVAHLYLPPLPPTPSFYRPFCTKYISEWLGWIFVFGWLDLKEGNLSRLKSQHRGCILNRPRREKARIYVSVPIPVNNMVSN